MAGRKGRALSTVRVAVAVPVKGTFSYSLPETLRGLVKPGCRILVPFNNRKVTGYVLEKGGDVPDLDLKDVIDILDIDPIFLPHMIPFFEWMADYYLCPLGMVIKAAVPEVRVKTATITPKGLGVLKGRLFPSKETEMLSWINKNREKRLPWPLKKLYPLEEKGWIAIRTRPSKRGKERPVQLRFVTPARGVDLNRVLAKTGGRSRAKGEVDFLKQILDAGAIRVSDLRAAFSNGSYLIEKWSKKKVLEVHSVPVHGRPHARTNVFPPPPAHRLNEYQERALREITSHLDKDEFSSFLLYGVTGSGKTEVYCRAVEHTIKSGRRAILMAPEISLAGYLEGFLRPRLGDRIAIYHSGLTRKERASQWARTINGEVDLVIGARSALFAPVPNLGLIVVDEEHDTAYAQDRDAHGGPRYHARDAAVVRAKQQKAVVVLGSGTPSVQSYENSVVGRYALLQMPYRVENRAFPEMTIVDMRSSENRYGSGMISPTLKTLIENNLAARNQTILFLNRRGYHRVYLCRSCGESARCPNCDVSLTHHLKEDFLACHYCGFRCGTHVRCNRCGHATLKGYGFGTERLETELQELFADARVSRMDADSTGQKGAAIQMLTAFSQRKIDILVGTQMITKGYDFPGVTLVGIISADLSLAFPDFRAGERTFQLLSQVSGRAGRGKSKGIVVVQTYNPDHYAIHTAANHDYLSFFEKEKSLRRQLRYPPFSHLACLRLQGNDKDRTAKCVEYTHHILQHILSCWPKNRREFQILGPVESPISRMKGKYRWQVLIKCGRASLLNYFLREVEPRARKALQSSGVYLIVDVDPYEMV